MSTQKFWKAESKSENPFLITNFTKTDDFCFEQMAKKLTFLLKKILGQAKKEKKKLWVKNAEDAWKAC